MILCISKLRHHYVIIKSNLFNAPFLDLLIYYSHKIILVFVVIFRKINTMYLELYMQHISKKDYSSRSTISSYVILSLSTPIIIYWDLSPD
jgi:hypothetical protein